MYHNSRMKDMLSGAISESQSAFVPRKLITDNTIIAFGTLHFMKRSIRGNKAKTTLKLDICMTYDMIE